jgi:surface antigen
LAPIVKRLGVGLGLAVCAAVVVVLHPWASGAARGAVAGGPVVYGYPYADQCPAAGIADAVDRWKMNTCNCTSYVAWALSANGQDTSWFIPGAMDAWNWPHVARLAGLGVGPRPRVGAVAVWPQLSRYGHLAYVTAVGRGGRFDVAEYNLPGTGGFGAFRFDRRSGLSRAGAVFVYVPRAGRR